MHLNHKRALQGIDGLQQEFEDILEANRDRLVRVARQYAGADEWQDLYQEIAVNLWHGLDGFDGRAAVSTWVYRVAINTALQHARRRRQPFEPLPDGLDGPEHPGFPIALLERFLRSLDPVNRAVLLLDLEGLSRDEIGDILGISGGAVAVRMTRLKQRFNRQYVEDA